MNLEKLYLSLGYTKDQFELIRNSYSNKRYSDDTFYKKTIDIYNYFISILKCYNNLR